MLTIMITMNDWISRRIKYVTKNDYLGSKSQMPLQGNYNFENIPTIAHKLIVNYIRREDDNHSTELRLPPSQTRSQTN